MPVAEIENKVISKTNKGFPAWLDFEKLRQEGIDYLGHLSGKIWTDHNLHDPGITILEVLCYALLDLGYRSSLPPEELFAKDPAIQNENNFFTAAQILACNPLTITDYRKLLVDIRGVKNAWLETAEDISVRTICEKEEHTDHYFERINLALINERRCISFLNGLYHVYIDLEDQDSTEIKKDPIQYREEVIAKVRKALMAHRNLCEDFFDITVLCKQRIGVCADIELAADAQEEQVYMELIRSLRNFFSPSPKFYRLPQLLEKGRTVEEIFAGRPFDLTESHGFVDIGEFENLGLKKEFHVSDVYNVINSVPGIIGVRNLQIRNCELPPCNELNLSSWIFKLYENHVAEFDPACSGFQFHRNGAAILIDNRKFKERFSLNFLDTGKTLIQAPSENIDLLIEPGNFRPELADYLPIENEFPKVYGITRGSLPDDVSTKRKSQAFQLKGYLLFFDHLLSGYLSQLKNIRNLFSINITDTNLQHTYYINKIANWPDLGQLLHYPLEENTTGDNLLAYPVSRQALAYFIKEDVLDDCEVEKQLKPFLFNSASDRDTALEEFMNDILFGNVGEFVKKNKSGGWSYYLFGSSEQFAILGTGPFESEELARKALSSLRYLATEQVAYRKYSTHNNARFSFNITSSVSGYWNFLQRLTESEELYHQRRNGFLDHLLSRFAEKFTDYAMLSYSFLKDDELQKKNIRFKEKFLSSYPELSSTRGKAYDYLVNGWHNENVSGLEKRFEAFNGIGLGSLDNLCHFEVIKFPEQTVVNLAWKDMSFFSSDQSFENREEGKAALRRLLENLTDPAKYQAGYSSAEDKYFVTIEVEGIRFSHPGKFSTKGQAEAAIEQFHHIFSPQPLSSDIYPSVFEHWVSLEKRNGDARWNRVDPVVNRQPVFSIEGALLEEVKNPELWKAGDSELQSPEFQLKPNPGDPDDFIDLNAFEPYINRVDVKNQQTIFKYTVSDPGKTFFFVSEQEFESEEKARDGLVELLFALTQNENYFIREIAGQFIVEVRSGKETIATNTIENASRDEAKISIELTQNYVNAQAFSLKINSVPVAWRTKLQLSAPGNPEIIFEGSQDFKSESEALAQLGKFSSHTADFRVHLNKDQLELTAGQATDVQAVHHIENISIADEQLETAREILQLKKALTRFHEESKLEPFEKMVVRDQISRYGDYGYQLVKKKDYHARYLMQGQAAAGNSKEETVKFIYKLYQHPKDFLDICYGGHNILEEKDERTGKKWYRYRIMTWGLPDPAFNEIVLFESIQAYSTAEEAQHNFEAEYARIMTDATDVQNYGKWILFDKQVRYKKTEPLKTDPVVFVPEETMKLFGYNHDYAKKKLAELAARYPVRRVREDEKLFADYYLCGRLPEKPEKENCEDEKKKKYYYYFIFRSPQDQTGAWISHHYYETAQQAREAFHFFLILLYYRGNYYITRSDCDCEWTLYLREILAVGKKRFITEESAWKEGVANFICASQSEDAFSAYRKDDGCCYSFHVACENIGLIHPCKYDSAEKRDKALARLFRASVSLSEKIKAEGEIWSQPSDVHRSPCERMIRGIDDFLVHVHDVNKLVNMYDKVRMITDVSKLQEVFDPAEIEEAKQVAHQFPVIKKNIEGSKEEKYYLQIRIPEFCHDDLSPLEPCGCDGRQKPLNCCCIAWESDCCFDSCEEALHYYYKVVHCLADIKNYYPVFDCECGPFGIRFYCDCEDRRQPDDVIEHDVAGVPVHSHQPERGRKLHCCSEILAFNPQCYTHPKMTCDAISRARALINAEGLHLVEHILLRPHCKDKDCHCLIPTCDDREACEFEWKLPDDDPCSEGKKFCFVPGADPYSFIATVVIPTWPERFRKKENRQWIERMIYREAPAHIMLRILWLAPHDLCEFESIYYEWVRWLANKKVCADYQPACRLIDFLFRRPYDCFECYECEPCPAGSAPPDPCNFSGERPEDPNVYANEINRLYCWPLICEQEREQQQVRMELLVEEIVDRIEEETQEEPDLLKKMAQLEPEEAERLINQRFYRYREAVREIDEVTKNANAARTASFINNPSPTLESYKEVLQEVMANKRTVPHLKLLSMEQKKELVTTLTWYFLDRTILDDKLNDYKNDFNEILQLLQKRELKPVYRNWKGTELIHVKPSAEVDVNEVHKLFRKS